MCSQIKLSVMENAFVVFFTCLGGDLRFFLFNDLLILKFLILLLCS